MKRNQFDQQITFIYTNDLKNTAIFYEETLEMELVLDQGKCRICRTSKNAYLGYCESDCEKSGRTGIILTLVTGDVDGWYELLKRKGVQIDEPPAENPVYKIYHFFFRDPNGYLIEIQQFQHPFDG